jgi:hypothetical protein
MLPFTHEQILGVFVAYNEAVWPSQVLAYLLGLLMLALVARPTAQRNRVVAGGLAKGWAGWLGWTLLVYAGIVYPLLGQRLGHGYPATPMFGITPCAVTIFTFGLFLLTTAPVPRRLMVIPLIWSLIGGSATFLLDLPQDWLLLVSGLSLAALYRREPSLGVDRPCSSSR